MIARIAALAIPVLCGLAWLAAAGAPETYLLVNAGALAIGSLIIVGWPGERIPDKPLGVFLVALLFLPLMLGPEVGGATRWIGLPPFMLTTAILCMPPLAVLTARAKRGWLVGGLALTFIAGLLQPDGSIVLALGAIILVLGRINLASITKAVLVGGIGFVMVLRDRLEPVPFVEEVLSDAAATNPLVAVGLVASLVASLAMTWMQRAAPVAERSALLGAVTALVAASILGPFPTPLLGYGASSILGFALGLALLSFGPKAQKS